MKKTISAAAAFIAASLFATWFWRYRRKKAGSENVSDETVKEALSHSEVP